MLRVLTLSCLVLVTPLGAHAAQVDFVRDVRPIFQKYCYSCHGATQQKSGLRLDIKSEALKGGGGYGPSIVAGSASESPLIELVTHDDADSRMPPEGQGPSALEIATLKRWINQGAVWPDGVDLAKLEDRLDHWSFQPISDPAVPTVDRSDWPRGPIDRFVLSRLEHEGLAPAPPADAVAWLRRVTLDLTGLPPTGQEVSDFLRELEDGEAAYAAVVDRLLDSPRYGERWAQHWLDVVRYADTHGFEVNTERPQAWPYRDYVIAAMNSDTPYDRFIKEQIVGDATGADAATGFLVTASVLLPGQIGRDGPSMRLARQDALDEIVNNIGHTFLGLSVGCARCHDHKFDPISAKDYYSMQSFVAGVEYKERKMHSRQAVALREEVDALTQRMTEIDKQLVQFVPIARPRSQRNVETSIQEPNTNGDTPALAADPPRRQLVLPSVNIDCFAPVRAKRLRFTVLATNNLEPCIDELEVFNTAGENIAIASVGTTVTTSGDTTVANRHERRFINDGKYGNSRSWMSGTVGSGWVELEFAEEQEITRVIWGRDREEKFKDRLAIEYRIDAASNEDWHLVADSSDRLPPSADTEESTPFRISELGNEQQQEAKRLLGEKQDHKARIKTAERGQVAFAGTFRKPDDIHVLARGDPERPQEAVVPAVLSAFGDLSLPTETTEQQRREALADWMASPENPLTARVMANRIWQGHFGIGLVETANDFGRNGAQPSHPELLDWLAQELIRSGWSIKHMHRLIVLSATYRQSTAHNAVAATKDADARLLWRFPSRRLEAEAIRDCMLAVSGRLNLTEGGPGFNLFEQRGGLSGFTPIESFTDDGLRRMIYAHKVRRERDAVFGAFDCPDAGQSTPRRIESTTPIQALNLLNSRFTIDQAEAFAERVQAKIGEDASEQIQHAYWIALNREPIHDELNDAEPVVRQHGLATLCRALFNSSEFLFFP